MKIVACKNCGVKYQLNDDDDISTYECSSCAGNLELIEKYYSEEDNTKSKLFTKPFNDNETVVQCEDCGLKYKLNKKENIENYECESCGGSLKHINKEHQEIEVETNKEDKTSEKKGMFADLPDKFENTLFDEKIDISNLKEKQHTARTKIPEYILSKFEREFDIKKVTNYDSLKDHLKKDFYKKVEDDYAILNNNEESSNITKKTLLDKIAIKNESNDLNTEKHDLIPYPNEQRSSFHYIYILIGTFISIVGVLDISTSNRGYGLIFLLIGIIILTFGIYKTRDYGESEKRGKIIREKLLTLPEEYYVLYYLKVPKASSGINHVVIGPSGIYSIISKKYYSKENSKLKSEKENNKIINAREENELDISDNLDKFHYQLKRDKFENNNSIKQKSLKLGENLINFLNENGFENLFVEPLVGFVNNDVAVINMPLTDEDLFLDELINTIKNNPAKLDSTTVHKCAVILSQYSAKCSS